VNRNVVGNNVDNDGIDGAGLHFVQISEILE